MLINILIQWRFIIKTFLQTLFFYLLLTQICLAQWVVYQPVTDLNQNDVCYAGADQISIVCDKGLVLETINSEVFWNQLQSINNSNLNTIFFVDDNNGFISGDSGRIFRTEDCRSNWIDISIDFHFQIEDIFFSEHYYGFANT